VKSKSLSNDSNEEQQQQEQQQEQRWWPLGTRFPFGKSNLSAYTKTLMTFYLTAAV